jgi:hypothetical protein
LQIEGTARESQREQGVKAKRKGYDVNKLQELIAGRDGWICHYCGRRLIASIVVSNISLYASAPDTYYSRQEWEALDHLKDGWVEATIDHVIPLSKGGDSKDPKNLVLSCRSCNARKRTRNYEEFRALIRGEGGESL